MAVMESVAVRQRGGFDFATHYDNLCALNNSCPLTSVKVHLKQNVLDINGDKIRSADWMPILNTIKINKTLEYIAIRSFYHPEERGMRPSNAKLKVPSIRSKELTYRLCRTLKECLACNPALRCLELQGLPFRQRDIDALAKGITKTTSLQHLSLENTCFGDEQLTVLCQALKNKMTVMSVNFTGCGLTWQAAEKIAEVIKHQATKRHSEAWQDSLRYRKPDLDRMAGLRRITANFNPLLGDRGVQILADALRDDLWVKAVDLHQCGIGEIGAKALLEILKFNTTLVVMDVRLNPLISKETMSNIMEQVCINCAGHETEYKWLSISAVEENPVGTNQNNKKRTKILHGCGRKMGLRLSSSSLRKRNRSAPSSIVRGSFPTSSNYVKRGTPWRTALRAAQCRGDVPDKSTSELSLYESLNDISKSLVMSFDQHTDEIDYKQVREMKVELEMLRRRGTDGSATKTGLERQVSELTSENSRLRHELSELQAKRNVLDDDRILDSIEQSFKQFHSFLDMLRDVGLGQLISMAGLDEVSLPFQPSSPARQQHDRSRLDTTLQMKSFLEQSHLDRYNLSFTSDTHQFGEESDYHRGHVFGKKALESSYAISPSQQNSRNTINLQQELQSGNEMGRKTVSKFDELYQKALRNTENILKPKEFQYSQVTSGISDKLVNQTARSDTELENAYGLSSLRFVGGMEREVEGASAQMPTVAGALKSSKLDAADNQLPSERSESVSHTAGTKRDASSRSDSLIYRESAVEPLSKLHRLASATTNPLPESKLQPNSALSDKASSADANVKIAAIMNADHKVKNLSESGPNDDYETVDEQTIDEDFETEELSELKDLEIRGAGGGDGAA